MLCPKCADRKEMNDTIILETRRHQQKKPFASFTTRRRRCVSCMFKFTTHETIIIKGADDRGYDAVLLDDMA
ncbi:MAG: hypothetical protein EB116_09155 [Betaproteobacteria bacterium]|jgi:transcriptional regulator NrdR family protein|nr:hypothetical protein [Betaproteobacteria bacterium]